MRIKSTFLKLFKREVEYDKTLKVYTNGEANDYPERVERLINNSVTAKQCVNIMTSFLSGKGFKDVNNFLVGKTTLLTAFYRSAKSIAKHRGAFIQVNYNLNAKITSINVLPFSHCRVGKKDDEKYNGKIGVCEDWSKHKSTDVTWIDVYNPKENVIL